MSKPSRSKILVIPRRSYVSQSLFQAELAATAPRRSAPAPVPAESPKTGHPESRAEIRIPSFSRPELSVWSLPRLQPLPKPTSRTRSRGVESQKYLRSSGQGNFLNLDFWNSSNLDRGTNVHAYSRDGSQKESSNSKQCPKRISIK